MITIILATYNGAAYLEPFLESLGRQTVGEWRLLVRDDGSSDDTCRILTEHAARDARISVLDAESRRLGARGNFSQLMSAARESGAKYVFFADQDDVWLPEKIAAQMRSLRKIEEEIGPFRPILVHSDLAVTNSKLQLIAPSFINFSHFDANCEDKLRRLLTHNFVTGSATLINQPLLQLASPVPHGVVMHDWWAALCAAAAGRVSFHEESLVLYRQHGENTVGARGWGPRRGWECVREIVTGRVSPGAAGFSEVVSQVFRLRRRLLEREVPLDPKSWALLQNYCDVFTATMSRSSRVRQLARLGLPDAHPLRRCSTYLRLLLGPAETLEMIEPGDGQPQHVTAGV